jgi:hypothetical protein
VRLTDVLVNEQRKTRSVYYAKAGRNDLQAVFDLELVPVAADASEFTLMWKGAPLPKAEVTVYGPPKWKLDLTTDERGHVKVPMPWAGRYVVETIHADERKDPAAEQLRAVATVSFITKQGLKWSDR